MNVKSNWNGFHSKRTHLKMSSAECFPFNMRKQWLVTPLVRIKSQSSVIIYLRNSSKLSITHGIYGALCA